MLKRNQRISKEDLATTASPYRMYKTFQYSVKVRKNDMGIYRFSFIVSKKIDKRAVVRNSLKRRMSEAVRILEKPHEGYDILIFLKKEALSLSQEQLATSIQNTLSKYHIV